MAQNTQGENEKKKRQRKRKSKQTLTRAVPHIRLAQANAGKLEALDLLSEAFMALTQQYVTLFCTRAADPDGYLAPVYATELSQRWQRVAIRASSRHRQSVAEQSGRRLHRLSQFSPRMAGGKKEESRDQTQRAVSSL